MKITGAAIVARTAVMSWLPDFVRMKPNIEQDRRDWVERHEYFRDDEEEFVRRKEAATTAEERRRLDEWFSPRRKARYIGEASHKR
jgi:hypothetical protein